MSGRGARDRRIAALERRIADLEKSLGNLPVRWPTPRAMPLLVDHEEHDMSTAVSEVGVGEAGHLHDVWKVVQNASRSNAPGRTDAETKLAFSICRHGDCQEGFVWGAEIAGYSEEFGWGRWDNIVGIEKKGESEVNFKTTGKWNNQRANEGKKIGPIFFDSDEDDWTWGDWWGAWILGKMIFDGIEWCPAFQTPGSINVRTRHFSAITPDPKELDHCNALKDPLRYRKLNRIKVWTVRGPFVNVHKVAACNRDDINGIFELLTKLDWHFGDVTGHHDNFFDRLWASAGLGVMGTWLGAVDALLAALSAFHPSTAGLYTAQKAANTAVIQQLPYTTKCPPGREYNIPDLEKCLHIDG